MKKNWIVATYKIKDTKRLKINLLNQNFDYYLPKIIIRNNNFKLTEEALFPGYVFVNTDLENYSSLKYTIGIKEIIKFGDNVPCLSDDEIEIMKTAEEKSKIKPLTMQLKIGQEATISSGSLKGNIVRICSTHSKGRVGALLNLLGSARRVIIREEDLIF